MAIQPVEELRELAERLKIEAALGEAVDEPLTHLDTAVALIAKSWSGSNLGYQSRVYYPGFETPPPGAHFDSEWGFLGAFQGTTGDWQEFTADDVVTVIHEQAGVADIDDAIAAGNSAHGAWTDAQPEIVSILAAYLANHEDPLIQTLKRDAEETADLTERQAVRVLVGGVGRRVTRDTTALSQGFMAAPHQVVEAKTIAVRSQFSACHRLANIAARAAAHIERVREAQQSRGQSGAAVGTNVFIGHGRSLLWRELKDFVSERLQLPWDEFNRVPVAGVTNIARLSEMLDSAGIAFLVLTAEDEAADGTERARQNVVHEAGLFQGRLGFTRAILLLEEGCDEFSNIQGLGQIRFPRGQIGAAFEEVRQVLERENFIAVA